MSSAGCHDAGDFKKYNYQQVANQRNDMKKIMMLLLAFCLVVPMTYADNRNKQLEKALKKEYKEKKKELKKEGWKLFGSSRSLDVALLSHYDKLQTLLDDGREVVGVATNVKSKNAGHQMAINNACITYGQQAGSQVKGRVVSDLAANGTDGTGEFDHFYAAYERLVQKEIRGEMNESFTIMREMSPGVYEFQTFFIVSESAASKARIRAMEDALKESEAAQKHAKTIADFVREGFITE